MKKGSAPGIPFRGYVCIHSLRPDDSLTILSMASSIGFQDSVSFLLTIQATGSWLLPWWDCFPLNAPAFAGHTFMPVYPGAQTSPYHSMTSGQNGEVEGWRDGLGEA
jgi:hypothetical protein